MQKYLSSGLFSSGNAVVRYFKSHIFASSHLFQYFSVLILIFHILYVLNSERLLFWIEFFWTFMCLLNYNAIFFSLFWTLLVCLVSVAMLCYVWLIATIWLYDCQIGIHSCGHISIVKLVMVFDIWPFCIIMHTVNIRTQTDMLTNSKLVYCTSVHVGVFHVNQCYAYVYIFFFMTIYFCLCLWSLLYFSCTYFYRSKKKMMQLLIRNFKFIWNIGGIKG